MEKPVNLRQETWDFLITKSSSELSQEELASHAAKYLHAAGIEDNAELLTNTIVVLEGDVEYKITSDAAKAIASADELIVLRRLDGQDTSIARAKIMEALKNDCEIDQMEEGA